MIREYEWKLVEDPFLFFVWPYVAKRYELTVDSETSDVRAFFLAEGAFKDGLPEEERLAKPWKLRKVCDGIILPGQSHTVSFYRRSEHA